MANIDEPDRLSSNFPTGLLEWIDLKSMALNPLTDQWKSRSPPDELQRLPDDEDPPRELSDILKWSLYRNDASGQPLQSSANAVSAHEQQNISAGLSAESAECLSPTHEAATVSETVSTRVGRIRTRSRSRGRGRGRSRSRHSKRSVSLERGASNSRVANSSGRLLSSAISLVNAIVGNSEEGSVAPVKAADEAAKPSTLECTSCFEDLTSDKVATLTCTHSYCKSCFTTLIMTSMQNEANFPPKCCLTEIPLTTIILALSDKERVQYKDKAAEYSIPAGRRWYCPSPNCSKWIPPGKLRAFRLGNQSCPHCCTKICRTCRGLAHDGNEDCPQDFGLEATLDVAESEGWQRCYSCRAMVELTTGCHHITCKCGAQFCYICGVKWRTCGCSSADAQSRREDLLRRRTERDAAMQAEAEEVAQAIAQVEAFEQQQAEIRRAEEEEERRREAEELARLEQMRLEEEERREKEDKEMERQRVEVMKMSVKEREVFLKETMGKIIHFQQSTLTSRHEMEVHSCIATLEQEESHRRLEAEAMTRRIISNIERRMKTLKNKHKAELDALDTKEHDSDDIFVNVQIFVAGKLTREEQERRATEEFVNGFKREVEKMQKAKDKARFEERSKIEERQKTDIKTLEEHSRMEQGVVDRSNERINLVAMRCRREKMDSLGLAISVDRKWFELVTERRMRMLERHCGQMLIDLEAGQEPVGLTEAMVPTLLPLPVLEAQKPIETDALREASPQEKHTWRDDTFEQLIPTPCISMHSNGSGNRVAYDRHGIYRVIADTSSLQRHTSTDTPGVTPSTESYSAYLGINSNTNPREQEAWSRENPLSDGDNDGFSEPKTASTPVGSPIGRQMSIVSEPLLQQKPFSTSVRQTQPQGAPNSISPFLATGLNAPAQVDKLCITMHDSVPVATQHTTSPQTQTRTQIQAKTDSSPLFGQPLATSASIETMETNLSANSGSVSTDSKEKKPRWASLGRKFKEKEGEEEVHRRMKDTIGEAVFGAKGGWM
jgi:hypothetical protein